MTDDGGLTTGEDEFGRFWKNEKGRVVSRERNDLFFKCVNAKTDDYITAMVANGVELRLNTMSDRVETDGSPITDIKEAVILNRLFDCDMTSEARMRRAMYEAANRNQYHPVRVYLESLEWDGEDRFSQLMGKIETKSDISSIFFRKWMIGSIAKVLDGAQNLMLVLVAAQGVGKSRLVRWLAPLQNLFYEGAIRPDDKDSLVRLINNWFWEVAELDATTRKADISSLKHIISTKRVKLRVPYGRYDIEKTAAASFVGTVNPDGTGFLYDTQNRRFAIIEIEFIDWSYEEIDIDQLWAQMYAAYTSGEQFTLTKEEQIAQEKTNELHTARNLIEDILDANFVFDKDAKDKFITTAQLTGMLENMGLRSPQYRIKSDLATAMLKRGLEKTRRRVDGKRQYGYVGIWGDVSADFVEKTLNL